MYHYLSKPILIDEIQNLLEELELKIFHKNNSSTSDNNLGGE